MNTPADTMVLDDEPTAEERAAMLKSFFGEVSAVTKERIAAMESAFLAVPRLAEAMAQRTDQSYTIRKLLFSLWNGKAADVSDVMTLDWSLRKDVCAVILAFGFEDGPRKFWYDELIKLLRDAGGYRLEKWFVQEGDEA
ncbi:MAG: hypothetical protein EBR48_05320 [bacterium]|nr:hypothetical protein [Candidatus Aquidulcis frankliniae]